MHVTTGRVMQVLVKVAVQSGIRQIHSDGELPSVATQETSGQRDGLGLQDHCLQLLLKDTWVAGRLVSGIKLLPA